MLKKRTIKKMTSVILSAVLMLMLVFPNINMNMFDKTAKADTLPVTQLGSGSIGVGTNSSEAANLPRLSKQGTVRFTTDNYNSNHEALDTNDWASNFLWDYEGDRPTDSTGALSGTAYAFPMYYLMKKDGLRLSKPSMTSNKTNISAYYVKDNDTLGDFKIFPDWTSTSSNVDEISDWSYRFVVENPNNTSQKMTTTMTQGSPFAFIELTNSNVIYLEKLRVTFPSEIIYEGTYNGSKMIVFRTRDFVSPVNGYPSVDYQYYAIYLPENATVDHLGTTDTTGLDGIGKLKITFPSGKAYMSFAWIDENRTEDKDTALNFAKEYRPYAFNFITDTRADYSFNESTSTLVTTYSYSFEKKAESTADGTIMGLLPHQYKYMSNYSTMGNDAITLRGMMKFMKGSSYKTNMTYKGILPYMPELSEDDTAGQTQLQAYVDEFMENHMSGSGTWTLAKDEGHETYYHGKKLNRSAQVVAAAKSLGDEESADRVLEGLESNLEDWFTYSGSDDDHYFTYLGEGVGVLLGFPSSFNSVDQFNDHHFHYGYFIQAAACVGLWDKEWLSEYKDVVKQLVYDIASPYRNQDDCVADCGNAYPYLRSFAPYEGHSWASGYEDDRTGNNQESTSESINAWAGIILFGEMIGDDEIRDLGIYLYTTEVAAADNYWFNIDEDIYQLDESNYDAPMASMVWGGKVDYSTYFGQQYTQGIQICPMQSWSFYLLNGGTDYIQKFYDYDRTSSVADGGSVNLWNDMWASYYALKDPETAMNSIWTRTQVNDGESRAHTYHYIQSMIDYGTPDLSYKSDSAMSSVFTKNGVQTFAVYNTESTIKTVTFTDALGNETQVKAMPNKMTLFSSEDIGKPSYTIEYYGKDLNSDSYSLMDTSIEYANAGTSVTAEIEEFTGYTYDSTNSSNKIMGTVSSDSSLVLKVYYTRGIYSVSYELNGGTKADTSKYPTSYTYGETYNLDYPTKEGYDFYGWYTDSILSDKLELIEPKTHGNLTLYAKWIPKGTILINEDVYLTFDTETKGTFTIIGDSEYDAVNVLYKVVDTESEAAQLAADKAETGFVSWGLNRTESGWTRTESFASRSGRYITFYFIRYDSAGGYKTDYGYGKITAGFLDEEPQPTVAETTTIPEESTEEQTDEETTTVKVDTTVEADTTVSETETSVTTKPSAPKGLTYAGNEALPYYFAWQYVEGAEYYNFYVNGKLIKEGIAYTAYNVDEEHFPVSGEYVIGVTVVVDGVESEMAVYTMNVEVKIETTTAEVDTTEEITTIEETTTALSDIVVSDDVKIEGYQISATKEGSRVVGSVEPEIDGKNVEKWGFVYAIEQAGEDVFSVPDEEMYVGTNNAYITSLESTSAGTSSTVLGDSETAKYFVRTTLFSVKTVEEFTAKYKVRAYAVLSDGSCVYSDISSYTVYDICDRLYQKVLMNNYSGHQYLYDNVLTVVNPAYEEIDYAWGGSVINPDTVN